MVQLYERISAHLPLGMEKWLGLFAYFLFIFSTFSISGVELSVTILYVLVIFHCLRNPPKEIPPRWIIAPFLLWIAVLIASALANPNVPDNLIALRHHYRILVPFALLLALRFTDLEKLLKVFLVFTGLIAVYGIFQMYSGVDIFRPEGNTPISPVFGGRFDETIFRARGNFSSPGYFGSLMMMAGLLFLSQALGTRKKIQYFWIAGAVLAAGGLIASFSRGAWLGVCVGLVILAAKLPGKYRIVVLTVMISSQALLFVSVNKGWLNNSGNILAGQAIISRILQSNFRTSGGKVRLILWKGGIVSIKRNPILGVGFAEQGKLRSLLHVPRSYRKYFRAMISRSDLHNIYLQIAFNAGLIGLGAFIGLWLAIFSWNILWIIRAKREFSFETNILWGTSAALVATLVEGVFRSNFIGGNANAMILSFVGLSFYAGTRIRSDLKEMQLTA